MGARLAAFASATDSAYAPLVTGKGGEVAEYRVRRNEGESPKKTLARALAILSLNTGSIPPDAWLSARVELAPDPDDAKNYKSMGGARYVPSMPYAPRSLAEYKAGVARIVQFVGDAQPVTAVVIRVGIAPPGFLAMSGDGIVGGTRVAVGLSAAPKGWQKAAKKAAKAQEAARARRAEQRALKKAEAERAARAEARKRAQANARRREQYAAKKAEAERAARKRARR